MKTTVEKICAEYRTAICALYDDAGDGLPVGEGAVALQAKLGKLETSLEAVLTPMAIQKFKSDLVGRWVVNRVQRGER